MFQLYFPYWIFSKSSFIFSLDCFMLATWAKGTNGRNISPLCGSTEFKLTFQESINATKLDHFGVQEPLYHSKHQYKIPQIFVREKFFEYDFCECETNILQHNGGEDCTLLVWNLRVQLVSKAHSNQRTRFLRSFLIKWAQMSNTLLQTSDRIQHCPLLAVRDYQNQSCHRLK